MTEDQVALELGRRLRLVRKWRKLTQDQLAYRTGYSRPAVVNIESGRQGVTVWRLLQWAAACDVPPHVLLYKPADWSAWVRSIGGRDGR